MSARGRWPRPGRLTPANLRAAFWAWRGLRAAQAALVSDGVRARVRPPPRLPKTARVGVDAVLRRTSPTCLERSLVLQAWLSAHDVAAEIVVGVPRGEGEADPDGRTTASGFVAHAWLSLETSAALQERYVEIYRIPAS